MVATCFNRLGPAAALVAALLACPAVPSAWAGGAGHGGIMMRAGGAMPGWHGAAGAMRPPIGDDGGPFRARRGLPPVSGIIHERPGMRPYLSELWAHQHGGRFSHAMGRVATGGYGHVGTGIAGASRPLRCRCGSVPKGLRAGRLRAHRDRDCAGSPRPAPTVARFGRNRTLGRALPAGASLRWALRRRVSAVQAWDTAMREVYGGVPSDAGGSYYGGGYGGGASFGAEGDLWRLVHRHAGRQLWRDLPLRDAARRQLRRAPARPEPRAAATTPPTGTPTRPRTTFPTRPASYR